MDHRKRARTRHLFRLMVKAHTLWSNAGRTPNGWSHKTAAEVLADVNYLLNSVRVDPFTQAMHQLPVLKFERPKFRVPFEGGC